MNIEDPFSWWQRKDLLYVDGELEFANRNVAMLANKFGYDGL